MTTPKRRWLQLAYGLGIILAMIVTFALGFAVPVKQGDGPLWLTVSIPFASGLAFGAMIPKWHPAILLAVFVGPVAICAVGAVLTAIDVITDSNPSVDAPLLVQCLATAVMILPGAIIYGSIPALAGVVLSHFPKRRNQVPRILDNVDSPNPSSRSTH